MRILRTPYPSASPPQVNHDWLDQIFASKQAATGGVVRRARRDVEREIGRDRLELEVRRRGFHLLATRTHYIIVCNRGPIVTIC